MTAKPRLSASLQRLLKRDREHGDSVLSDWVTWFSAPHVKQGHLQLNRAGEEIYASQLLAVRRDSEGRLVMVVDALLPAPEENFWHEPVSLHGTLTAMEGGVEEIATFVASVGERVEHDGRPAVELENLMDLELERREYVAELGPSYDLELSFIWFGEWVQIVPDEISISRLFFDADLDDHEIGVDGYAVPKAVLRLERGGPEIPVQIHLMHRRGGGYEARIEKIDGVARQKIVGIVEEIWRTAVGLSRRSAEEAGPQKGYMSDEHDALASAFEPHIVFLSRSERWRDALDELAEIVPVESLDLEDVSEAVGTGRCDLLVADADLWGERAVKVERLMRSVAKFRDIPRIWFTGGPPEHPDVIMPDDENAPRADSPQYPVGVGGNGEEQLDLVDYGAFDLLDRDLPEADIRRRVGWALGGDSLGHGRYILLISQNKRVRYRLPLALAGEKVRVAVFGRMEGLLPALEKRQPRAILLDAGSFEVEIDAMLQRTLAWARPHGAKVFVLARGVDMGRVTNWLKAGAHDIVLLDPSMRRAAGRLHTRLHGSRS